MSNCPKSYDTPFDAMTNGPGKPMKRGVECVKCGKCGKWHVSKMPAKEAKLFDLPLAHAIREEDEVS